MLSGLRFTSCRDGLIKSSLAVSLEQTRLLAREFGLPGDNFHVSLDTIRSAGLQREKWKKCDVKTVQFNQLPPQYRPPLGSFASLNI